MKKEKIIAVLLGCILLYLFFAVCAWNLNMGHWGGFWRGLYAFLAICIIFEEVN